MKTPYVFTTSEASQSLLTFARDQVKNKKYAISWPNAIPSLKEAPAMFPGQVMVLQSCSGEGKSTISKWWIKQIAKSILIQGDESSQNKVLSCVLEETIEKARANTMSSPIVFSEVATGNADLKKLLRATAESANDPIYYVGPSMAGGIIHPNAAEFEGIKPRHLGEIVYNLQSEQNINIVAATLDYIQIMSDNAGTRDNMTSKVLNASNEILNVARSTLRCPIMVCAQSKVEVKGRQNKIPGLYDVQWSSQIAQDADIVWSIWKISQESFGTKVYIGGVEVYPFDDVYVVSVCKWRDVGMSGLTFILCSGKPFGEFFEIPFDFFSSLGVDQMKAMRVRNFMDLPENVRKF